MKYIPAIILLCIGLAFGETTIANLTDATCAEFENFSYKDGALHCSELIRQSIRGFYIALIAVVSLFLLRFVDLILAYRDGSFLAMRRELELKYDYEHNQKREPNIEHLKAQLTYLKNAFEHHMNVKGISISVYVMKPDISAPDHDLQMLQVYEITSGGSCIKPAYPAFYKMGDHFVGLAWRHKQVRLGERKYLGLYYNRAYHRLPQQKEDDVNSFLCIPLFRLSDKTMFSVVSIESPRHNTFSTLKKMDKSHKKLAEYIGKILGYYCYNIYMKDDADAVSLNIAAHVEEND